MFGELIGTFLKSKASFPVFVIAAIGLYAYMNPQIFQPAPPVVSVAVMDTQPYCFNVQGEKTNFKQPDLHTGYLCIGLIRLKGDNTFESNVASAYYSPNTLIAKWDVRLFNTKTKKVTAYIVNHPRLPEPSSEVIDYDADPGLLTVTETIYVNPQTRDPNIIELYPKPTPPPPSKQEEKPESKGPAVGLLATVASALAVGGAGLALVIRKIRKGKNTGEKNKPQQQLPDSSRHNERVAEIERLLLKQEEIATKKKMLRNDNQRRIADEKIQSIKNRIDDLQREEKARVTMQGH